MRPTTIILVISFFFFWIGPSALAQFGIQGHLALATFETDMSVSESNLFRHEGVQVSANYWFRLENIRIEFFPEVSYSQFQHNQPSDVLPKTFGFSQWGLAIPISIYPFDLGSDCNCPTFSKQNETFKKGFFVQIAPGYYFSTYKPKAGNLDAKQNNDYFGFGAGIGLDLGLSDLITMSPIVTFNSFLSSNTDNANLWLKNDLMLGVRVLLRPDYQSPF